MNWKNILSIAFILILILILLLITNSIIQSCNQSTQQSNHPLIHHSIDTVYSKPDTLILKDTVYIPKLHAILDTVYLQNSTKVVTAAADTTLIKDSSRISVKYFFPPLNFFELAVDIKERIITKTKTITEVKEFEKPLPLFKNEFFWSTVALFVLLINNVIK